MFIVIEHGYEFEKSTECLKVFAKYGNANVVGDFQKDRCCAGPDATTKVVNLEILPSARKHGVSDDDIRHAFENALASITVPDRPEFTMIIGPDHSAQFLEIGVLADDDDDYVIHAMQARLKYIKMIRSRQGEL